MKAFARRTERLAEAQRAIGLALGGEAGARYSKQLHMAISPDTLLRLVGDSPEPVITSPKVLGIDGLSEPEAVAVLSSVTSPEVCGKTWPP